MQSIFARIPPALIAGLSFTFIGCTDDPVVWPISGDAAGDWTYLASTYGPRIRPEDGAYDFHRGIDIVVPERTNVRSIAHGTVMLIEQTTEAGGMRVQVAHDGYVSNYMHLLKVETELGDVVDPGDTIATSGTSSEDYAHLHFEIREPGTELKDCVHPFRVLPWFDRGMPSLEFGDIDTTIPQAPKVTIRVSVRPRELDLVRVAAATFEAPPDANLDGLEPLSEQSWDMEQWNAEKTVPENDVEINDPAPNGIEVRPDPFTPVSDALTIEFTFRRLVGPSDPTHLRVRAEAADIVGNVVTVTSP